jgi:hypothetical protein
MIERILESEAFETAVFFWTDLVPTALMTAGPIAAATWVIVKLVGG